MIAVVDDDESVRRALKRLIRSMGWQGGAFATAEEFLQSTKRDLPDCLILDVHLPGMSGLELQKRLAVEALRIPIVFITADPDAVPCESAMPPGAVAFLCKPFNEDCLLKALARCLRSSRP